MTEAHLRASALTFTDLPDPAGGGGYRYLDDAVLTWRDGRICSLLSAEDFSKSGGDLARCEHLSGALMLPGFIDAHVHAPQLGVMASYGQQLLDWLENAADREFLNYPFLNEYDPFLDNVRGEELFKTLMDRVREEWESIAV